MYSIYKVTNNISGKIYIGFSSNFIKRKSQHKKYVLDGTGFVLHDAIRKYGWDNFEWEIIYESWDRNHCLKEMEPYFIKEYKSSILENGYNMTRGGERGPDKIKRKPLTEEQRKRISEGTKKNAVRGKNHHMFGQKPHENFIITAKKGTRTGISWTEEVKRKISESNKGKKNALGHKHSENTKKIMSEMFPTWLKSLRAQTWRAIKYNRACAVTKTT